MRWWETVQVDMQLYINLLIPGQLTFRRVFAVELTIIKCQYLQHHSEARGVPEGQQETGLPAASVGAQRVQKRNSVMFVTTPSDRGNKDIKSSQGPTNQCKIISRKQWTRCVKQEIKRARESSYPQEVLWGHVYWPFKFAIKWGRTIP